MMFPRYRFALILSITALLIVETHFIPPSFAAKSLTGKELMELRREWKLKKEKEKQAASEEQLPLDVRDTSEKTQIKGVPEEPMIDVLYSDLFFETATRSLQPISRVTDNVTVITREELDKWPVADLDEALGFVNGIGIRPLGRRHRQARRTIRVGCRLGSSNPGCG